MFQRRLDIGNHSFFLFGARGTGKTTLLSHFFSKEKTLWIDLLDPEVEEMYIKNPKRLEAEILEQKPQWVVIDEVQRIPKLLNIAHKLIESKKQKFALTGSSARKLKRGQANLLAGRAFVHHLFPLTHIELASSFQLHDVLSWGSLPKVFQLDNSKERTRYLKAYAHTYLREEIQAEQILRKLEPFRFFLEVAAQCSGKIINSASIAKDIGVDTKTVQSYYKVLEETWLGFFLPAYHASFRKSQRLKPKFYLFDIGVTRALNQSLGVDLNPSTAAYGECFEHLVILEAFRLNHYSEKDYVLSYFHSERGLEIDLILSRGKELNIVEIKSKSQVDEREVLAFERKTNDFPEHTRKFYVSQDKSSQKIGGVRCLHWQAFLKEIF